MPHPLTIPTMIVLAAAGSLTGVYLGRSAIAEIDPIYYSEAETRFHADLVPNPPNFDAPPVTEAGQLTEAEIDLVLGSGCVNCRAYVGEHYAMHDSSVDKYQPGYAEMIETPEPASAEDMDASEKERAADFAVVERYASYPVTQEAAAPNETDMPIELASAQEGEPSD